MPLSCYDIRRVDRGDVDGPRFCVIYRALIEQDVSKLDEKDVPNMNLIKAKHSKW